jgi:hypothetical protein
MGGYPNTCTMIQETANSMLRSRSHILTPLLNPDDHLPSAWPPPPGPLHAVAFAGRKVGPTATSRCRRPVMDQKALLIHGLHQRKWVVVVREVEVAQLRGEGPQLLRRR